VSSAAWKMYYTLACPLAAPDTRTLSGSVPPSHRAVCVYKSPCLSASYEYDGPSLQA